MKTRSALRVRDLEAGEEPILWDLFYTTIRTINTRDYTEAQVRAWAPDGFDPALWAKKMDSIAPFVAEAGSEIVGYSDLQPDGLIDHFFVHHRWQRRGVGRALMTEIERRAAERGIGRLYTHASITARPFFEAFGFVVVDEDPLELDGERLTNFLLQRELQRNDN
ncbi:MAG: GNAT family N-acetyltransferase [Gammaproteobacteria bacterium]|nr:GNAT family N-acetyltransferase [Gammaproteobacteria bacterium]